MWFIGFIVFMVICVGLSLVGVYILKIESIPIAMVYGYVSISLAFEVEDLVLVGLA